MSQVTQPIQKRRKYQTLRAFPFVIKTLKFKQAALMQEAIATDSGLLEIMQRFSKLGVPRSEWQYFLTGRGACSVFSMKWLAEILGVRSGFSLGSAQAGERGDVPDHPGRSDCVKHGPLPLATAPSPLPWPACEYPA